ncbi:DNA-binding transcriptional regulator, AcrR family [Ferrimonas sediminum]|uniref:DNA-binding transcriptional regulator, AcrR family n=1 Tax=Ferrimonas sediminum TaxID=718193 RepID=A0A1G8X2T3_9GAMM|nr:TetR/AcrR family transcriptional regulator [Ferrimonas sediminum]SDJ84657.1 DNA-binding transcriptional regulator, AcrR family [Ferrimonas sediminum]
MSQMACSLAEFQRLIGWNPQAMWHDFHQQCLPQLNQKNPGRTEARLATIVEATFTLANRQGFHAMSLRQLSDASGMSLGGLYGYFASKDQLATSIHQFIRYQFEQVLLPLIDALPDSQRLFAICRYHLYLSELMQPWFFFAYMEARHQQEDLRKQAIALSERVDVELLLALDAIGEMQEPVIAVGLLKHLLQGWYLRRAHFQKSGVDVDAYTDYLLSRIESLCHGDRHHDRIHAAL